MSVRSIGRCSATGPAVERPVTLNISCLPPARSVKNQGKDGLIEY